MTAAIAQVPGRDTARLFVGIRNWGLGGIVVAFLLLVFAWAIAPSAFTSFDPEVGAFDEALVPPSLQHPFGTDYLGRDLLARVIYGARLTLLAGILAVLVGVVTGSIIGFAAATLPSWVDSVLMRIIDVLLSIPSLLLSLCLLAVVGAGIEIVSIAVGIGSIALFARFVRAQVLRIKPELFIRSARISGASYFSVLGRHILPNLWVPLTALVIVEIGQAVLSISVLGYLGYGAPPPTPEWGLIIAEGRAYLNTAWWLTTLPGLVLVASVALLSVVQGWLVNRSNSEAQR